MHEEYKNTELKPSKEFKRALMKITEVSFYTLKDNFHTPARDLHGDAVCLSSRLAILAETGIPFYWSVLFYGHYTSCVGAVAKKKHSHCVHIINRPIFAQTQNEKDVSAKTRSTEMITSTKNVYI